MESYRIFFLHAAETDQGNSYLLVAFYYLKNQIGNCSLIKHVLFERYAKSQKPLNKDVKFGSRY
jgi:hypothetical protein